MGNNGHSSRVEAKKVWIDLDNSPHVPFFAPIVDELQKRGYSVLVTARDFCQVRELAQSLKLDCKLIGRHYGKNKLLKLAGLCLRALQLTPTVLREKPDLAVSHGSRAQLLAAALTGVPSLVMMDYEFAQGLVLTRPAWVMLAEPIPEAAVPIDRTRILKYPGIKEDVYVPKFKPDPAIRTSLGIGEADLMVTVRPPANEAHYHNPESDKLFEAVLDFLSDKPNTKIVLLPRYPAQELAIRKSRRRLFAARQVVVPERAVDGLNLIWYSDLVISGGGTMNREAAALGVPVYSIFRGKIGAVDRYLADMGRLVLLESTEDVRTKIALNRRRRPPEPDSSNNRALATIVETLAQILRTECPTLQQATWRQLLMLRKPAKPL